MLAQALLYGDAVTESSSRRRESLFDTAMKPERPGNSPVTLLGFFRSKNISK
jgi:hypothetical protein